MSEYGSQISRGRIPGKTRGDVFAVSKNVGVSLEDLWEGKALSVPVANLTYLTNAEKMNVKSTSSDDSLGGLKSEIVIIDGVGEGYVEIQEVVTLNGTTNVLTVNKFLGINSTRCVQNKIMGENNAGDITLTSELSVTIQDIVLAGNGNSHGSHYYIPKGKEGLMKRLSFTGEKNAEYTVEFVVTPNTQSGSPSQLLSIPVIFFESSVVRDFEIPIFFPETSRIKIIAESDTGPANKVAGSFDFSLIEIGIR